MALEHVVLLILPGNPVPWAAPRVGKRTYDIRADEKNAIRWQIKAQYRNEAVDSPIHLKIQYFMPIPKAMLKKIRKEPLIDSVPHASRPDLDNCNKLYIDCLKSIVIKDDNLVYQIWCEKTYSENPRTEINVWKWR